MGEWESLRQSYSALDLLEYVEVKTFGSVSWMLDMQPPSFEAGRNSVFSHKPSFLDFFPVLLSSPKKV
jgi:hypothetical protein